MASDNRTLGRFHLDGIPPAPRGVPKIEVTFDIDANGIIHVTAKDTGTSKQQAITITGHSGLDDKEINRMVKDAESHSAEDKKRREVIEAKNQADQLVYSLEKLLRENKDRIPESEAEHVRAEIENTKKAIESENSDRIKQAMESLSRASHKMTEMMYQNASQQQSSPHGSGQRPPSEGSAGPGGGNESGSNEGEVIDAEVVDEDKKS
jgi:molecular chaperone DnaK